MSGLSKVIVLDPDARAGRQLQLGFQRERIPAEIAEVPRDPTELTLPAKDAGLVVVGGDPRAIELVRHARRCLGEAEVDAPIVWAGRGVRRTDAESAGADEVLLQPTYLRDVVTIARLLRGHPAAHRSHLTGNLAETTGVLTLVRALAALGRSAVLTLHRGLRRGEIRFYHGEVTSATIGMIYGQAALHQLLLWTDARFDYYHEDIVRRHQIPLERDELFADAERFLAGVRESSGPLSPSMVLEQDSQRVKSFAKEIPVEVHGILRMFDGHRVLADVLEDSPYRVFETLRVAQLAVEAGLLRRSETQQPRATWRVVLALEEWLIGAEPRDEADARASDGTPVPKAVSDGQSGGQSGGQSAGTGRTKSGPNKSKGSRRKRKKRRTSSTQLAVTPVTAQPRPEIDWGALVPRVEASEVGPLAGVVPASHASGEITMAPQPEKLETLTDLEQRNRMFSTETTVFWDDTTPLPQPPPEPAAPADPAATAAPEVPAGPDALESAVTAPVATKLAELEEVVTAPVARPQPPPEEPPPPPEVVRSPDGPSAPPTEQATEQAAEQATEQVTEQMPAAQVAMGLLDAAVGAAPLPPKVAEAPAPEAPVAVTTEPTVPMLKRPLRLRSISDVSDEEPTADEAGATAGEPSPSEMTTPFLLVDPLPEAQPTVTTDLPTAPITAARVEAAARAGSEPLAEAQPTATSEITTAPISVPRVEPEPEPEPEPPHVAPPHVAPPLAAAPPTTSDDTPTAPVAAAVSSEVAETTDAEPRPRPRSPSGPPEITIEAQPPTELPPVIIDLTSGSGAPDAELFNETSDGIIRQTIASAETAPTSRRLPSVIPEDDRPEDAIGEIDTKSGPLAMPEPRSSEPSILVADLAEAHTAVAAIAAEQAAAPRTPSMATPVTERVVSEVSEDAADAFSDLEEDFFRAGSERSRRPLTPTDFGDLDDGYQPVGFWDRLLGRKPKR